MPVPRGPLVNTEGFSLLEVMISMVLMVTVLLGMADFTKMGANLNQSVQLNDDFGNVSSSILYTLSSTKLCTEALGNGINATNEQPFDITQTPYGNIGNMSVGGTNGVVPSPIFTGTGPLGGSMAGLSISNLSLNKIYASYTIGTKINYIANLYLEGTKKMSNGQAFLGAPIISRNFLVNINVDPGTKKVLGCN